MKCLQKPRLLLHLPVLLLTAGWLVPGSMVHAQENGDDGGLSGVVPVGTAFHYQGKFTQNGAHFTGSVEFIFTLWDSPVGGSFIAESIPQASIVMVSGDLFDMIINFGTVEIRTNRPNIKVSWQVTGIRNDAYVRAHPWEAEQDKPEHERGLYLSPVEHGQPFELGIGYQPPNESSQANH